MAFFSNLNNIYQLFTTLVLHSSLPQTGANAPHAHGLVEAPESKSPFSGSTSKTDPNSPRLDCYPEM
jgi:hypothetical protein